MRTTVDQSHSPSPHSLRNKLARVLWGIAYICLFRPTPKVMHRWRRLLLQLFGARIGRGSSIYPSVRIWAPWNLTVGSYSSMAHHVDCYCVDKITIGDHCTISQYSFLCTASHDYHLASQPLITSPIHIDDGVWVAADVFVGPGVRIGAQSVIGARSSVFNDVPAKVIAAGYPARPLKPRIFGNAPS